MAGVIYDAARDELFWSEKGIGAYLNDTRLRVSERRYLSDCCLGVGHLGGDKYLSALDKLFNAVNSTRNFGSEALDLAYVAAGRIDGVWQNDIKLWEIAAGILMVREAGGYSTDASGKTAILKDGNILSANTNVHQELVKTLKS